MPQTGAETQIADDPASHDHAFLFPLAEVAPRMRTNIDQGLTSAEAAERLSLHGPNELRKGEKVSPVALFLEQLRNPLLIILLVGAALSAFTGHWVDAIAIFVIVLINAVISFWQEYRAETSLAALSDMAAPTAFVRRDGAWVEKPARDIVRGDVLRIKAGDILGADVRLVEANQLQVDEAPLTGESEPVEKHSRALRDPETVLADRRNMGFMSTLVANGAGLGVVTSTGMDTEVGHIANLMESAEEPRTPLQQRIDSLSKTLMGAAFLVVAIVVGIGLNNGMDAVEMLNTAISLSVAAIPEGLPTIVTIVLTLGSQNMVEKNALVRRLASVETLGTTSVICSDKTGTLTQNQMQVMRLWSGGDTWKVTGEGFDPNGEFLDADGTPADINREPDLRQMLMISAYCNDATLIDKDGRPGIQGNPTEGALVVAAAKAGITRQGIRDRDIATLRTFPFDSTRKMMSVLVRLTDDERLLVAKGAPDVILRQATAVRINGDEVPLSDAMRAQVEAVIDDFGSRALRTLAVAYKRVGPGHDDDDLVDFEQDVVLIGVHGIMDPPRPEVTAAVEDATSAGIRTVMITGDHAATAQAIAEEIGIKTSDEQTVHTGVELDAMSDAHLQSVVPHAAVFARVTPEHKLRIVKALQETGEVTAMTGDGVNDAPALRTADIGVAMGITGTSVAKDSASLVLLDDNFSTIVSAVREGRRIYDNLLKFIRQALTANVAEVSAILFAFILMGADPLLTLAPLMILWINLVSDGLPALALGFEPGDPDLMERKPRARNESIFADGLKERILIRGLALGGLTFFVFRQTLNASGSLGYAQTMAFATLIFAQLWHIFDARSSTTIFNKNPLGNPMLLGAVALSAVLSLGAIYLPPMNYVLGTEPLALRNLFQAIFLAALPTFALSGLKAIFGWRFL